MVVTFKDESNKKPRLLISLFHRLKPITQLIFPSLQTLTATFAY
jgi:hypothetical protein